MGVRQVGETTLFDHVVSSEDNVLHLNCDDYEDKILLEEQSSTVLRQIVGEHRVIFHRRGAEGEEHRSYCEKIGGSQIGHTNSCHGVVLVRPRQ